MFFGQQILLEAKLMDIKWGLCTTRLIQEEASEKRKRFFSYAWTNGLEITVSALLTC